jgi:hypothetical protein
MAAQTWRFVGFNVPQRRDLALSKLQLLDAAGAVIPMTQASSSHAPISGSLTGLAAGGGEVRFSGADVAQPGFFIQFDAAVPVDVARIKIAGPGRENVPAAVVVYEGAQWSVKLNYRGIAYDADVENLDGRALDAAIASVSMLVWPTGGRPVDLNINQINLWKVNGGISDTPSAAALGGRTWRFPSGGGSWLAAPSNPAIELGSGDFTFEARIKTSKSGDVALLDKYSGSGTWQMMLIGGKLGMFLEGNLPIGATIVSDGAYHEVAIERYGNRLRAYVDRRLDGDIAFAKTIPDSGIPIAIGAQAYSRNATYDFVGDIDYVRITRGLARYSSGTGYVPPQAMPAVLQEAAESQDGSAALLLRTSVLPGSVPVAQGLQATRRTRVSKLIDTEFGGTGRIYGTVARKATPANTPLSRRVRLHRSADGYLARETWSKADGSYEFRELNPRYEYDVIACDHERQEFSTVANNQLAEVVA